MIRQAGAFQRGVGVRLFLFIVLVYLLTVSGHIQVVDVESELNVAQSFLQHGTFIVAPGLGTQGRNGAYYSEHTIGESVLLVPAALAGEVVPAGRSHQVADFVASLLNPVMAALTALLLFTFALELGASTGAAVAVALLYSFATIQWPYAHFSFDVTPTGFCFLLALWALHRYTGSGRRSWLVLSGCALGFAILLRLPAVVCYPVLALYLVTQDRSPDWGQRIRALLIWTVPVIVAGAVTAWYAWARFGTPFETNEAAPGGFSSPLLQGIGGLLISPGKSLLLFSPILLLGVAGLPHLLRAQRPLALALLGMVAVNVLFYAPYADWSGDWAWGPRFMVPLTALLLLPAAGLLTDWAAWPRLARIGVIALTVLSLAVQVIGVTVDYQLDLELMHNAGTLGLEYWTPRYSQILTQGGMVWQVIMGTAPYPSSHLSSSVSAGRPPINTWDFWWNYAWLTGISHRLVIAALIVAVGLTLWAGVALAGAGRRTIRPTFS